MYVHVVSIIEKSVPDLDRDLEGFYGRVLWNGFGGRKENK